MAYKVTTPGRVLLASLLPEDMREEVNTPMDKQRLREFFSRLALKHPDKYETVMAQMAELANEFDTDYGQWTSISLKDLRPPKEAAMYRERLRSDLNKIIQRSDLTPEEKNKKVVAYMNKHLDEIRKVLVESGVKEGNALAYSTKYGFRGNPLQLAQMLVGDLLISDNSGKPVPYPILNSYSEGLTPLETFIGSYGSRSGYMDVQFATADTGYLAKQLRLIASGQTIGAEDCGTQRGVKVSLKDPNSVGRVLAEPVGGLPAGTVLTPAIMKKLKAQEVLVRSPLTCELSHGLCMKCAGLRPDGKWPKRGEFVGFEVAGLISEPMTQKMALSSKHTGGLAGKTDVTKHGFEEIDEFLQVPETFSGAVHTTVDGTISKIEKASQGGYNVYVDDQNYYIPEGKSIVVKLGDKVFAGDALTAGTQNPKIIAMYKGVGEGRKYFADKLAELLEKNGVGTYKTNVDILARAYVSNLRITDPDGVAGFKFGEIVPYDILQKKWVPRKDAAAVDIKKAEGGYLEVPVLHFSIGTRVTPAVLQILKKNGISSVLINKNPPGFEPYVVRAASRTVDEPDWKLRLGGFYLKKAYENAVTTGAADEPFGQPSVFGGLMDPNRLPKIKPESSLQFEAISLLPEKVGG